MVQRRHMQGPVVPASGGHPTQRIQAVGQRGAGHRGEPAVADRELLRQVIVDRHVRAVVVAHYEARVAVTPGQGGGRTGDEATHAPAGDLPVYRGRGMIRVHPQGRRAQMVHGVSAPLVMVGEARAQAIDIRVPVAEGQVPQHVVERAVLQHHDHHMVDLRQAGGAGWVTLVDFHRCSVARHVGMRNR